MIPRPEKPANTGTTILKNEPEHISEDENNDIQRRKFSTQMDKMDASKWIICRTMPFYFCYHVSEKGLSIITGNNRIILRKTVKTQ